MLKFSVIPKKYRLDKREIKTIFENGKKIKLNGFSIYYQKTDEEYQCAVIVSTKVSKKSVVRNRIKRIFKNAFFQLAKHKKIAPAKIVIVVNNDFDLSLKSTDLEKLIKIK
ncbi:MAG: hypothetical protein KatS3mg085_610 [Candidatus Dojkabacteria bacterium]|nr:MAG: hypothetical protein KatS3mg085_610 [Candidatus Dojkabacteria bacterium]